MLRPTAVEVSPQNDYTLKVVFDNGEVKIFDVKPLIKGSWFGELSDLEVFKTVSVTGLSVEWKNGQDICPDDLYYLSVPKNDYDIPADSGASRVAETETK